MHLRIKTLICIRPSCRYRGYANAAAASYQNSLELIDFLPKVGMNTFMVEFRVPVFYTDNYYSHKRNAKNRPPEKVSNNTILQWKRGTECEAAKRGLVFHDVGHGFCIDPFGIDSCLSWNVTDESCIPDTSRKFLAKVEGRRGFAGGVPVNTNFCMSNHEARKIVADYVATYAEQHKNVDVLHVWLSDGINAHCECDECVKMTTSDWYMMLMNDIDEEMTRRGIDTKIVFLAYIDTVCAPEKCRIKNPDRFIFMLAPFIRSYYDSIPQGGITASVPPYKRNDIYVPKTLEEYLVYYKEWRKSFPGHSFAFEYHFCWAEYRDLSALKFSRVINDEIKLYKKLGIDGVVEDGDIRCFLPNGLQFYTMARSLFDVTLTAEAIKEDYFIHAYGEDYLPLEQLLKDLEEVMDFAYFSKKNSANERISVYYNPELAQKIEEKLPCILAEGREIIKNYYNDEVRIRTVSARLLEHYLDLAEWLGRLIARKCVGDDKGARKVYAEFEEYFGKKECEIERYFNQCFFFNYIDNMVFGDTCKITANDL